MKTKTNLPPDTELETKLQDLYILAKHWLQDISFMEEELQFFKIYFRNISKLAF